MPVLANSGHGLLQGPSHWSLFSPESFSKIQVSTEKTSWPFVKQKSCWPFSGKKTCSYSSCWSMFVGSRKTRWLSPNACVPVELGLEDSDRLERFFSLNPFARLARDAPFMAVWDPGVKRGDTAIRSRWVRSWFHLGTNFGKEIFLTMMEELLDHPKCTHTIHVWYMYLHLYSWFFME